MTINIRPACHDDAVSICIKLESFAPLFGCHVALTGGTLYKPGERKDIDILFYRIRQIDKIDKNGLFSAMKNVGFSDVTWFGWCHKTKFDGFNIDLFFPEAGDEGEYNHDAPIIPSIPRL